MQHTIGRKNASIFNYFYFAKSCGERRRRRRSVPVHSSCLCLSSSDNSSRSYASPVICGTVPCGGRDCIGTRRGCNCSGSNNAVSTAVVGALIIAHRADVTRRPQEVAAPRTTKTGTTQDSSLVRRPATAISNSQTRLSCEVVDEGGRAMISRTRNVRVRGSQTNKWQMGDGRWAPSARGGCA